MLQDIKQLFLERKRVSLHDCAVHCDADVRAMEKMLDHWIHKGFIRKQPAPLCAGHCNGCGSTDMCDPRFIIYEIVE